MNNKGMTLIELLGAISLIGIVASLIFTFLFNLKNAENEVNFNYDLMVDKLKIVREVQNDLQKEELINILSTKDHDKVIINFVFSNNFNTYLYVYPNRVEYQTLDKDTYTYNLDNKQCLHYIYSYNKENNDYYLKLNILGQDNNLEDLEITYYSSGKLNIEKDYINDYIGNCTN